VTEPTKPIATEDVASEKPTTYGKKAQVTAIALTVIIVLGLIVQSVSSMRSRESRQAAKEANEAKKDAEGSSRKENGIDLFVKAQNNAAEKSKSSKDEQGAEERREKAKRNLDGTGGESTGSSEEVTEESLRHAQRMNDIKIALAASSGKMGHNANRTSVASTSPQGASAANTSTSQMAAATTAMIDSKIKEIEAKQAENLRQRQLYENSMGGVPSKEGISPPSTSRTNSLPNQVFGELSTNRVSRDPAHAGPKEGEAVVVTGSIISAVLDTDIISDYPGNSIAVVQRPFYDTAMENVIFPAGTKITLKNMRITSVNEIIQNRMAVIPQWIIRPDGKRIDFKKATGMDSAGVGALQDQVDRHVLAQVLGVGAYAILGLGPSTSSYGAEPNSSKDAFVREATAQSRNLGRAFAEKYLNIVPSITIRAGTPIKIFIEDDIFVTPWESVNAEHFRPVRRNTK